MCLEGSRKGKRMNKLSRRVIKVVAAVFLILSIVLSQTNIHIASAAIKLNPEKEEKSIEQKIEKRIDFDKREKTELIIKYKSGANENMVKTKLKQNLKLGKLESKKKYNQFKLDILQIDEKDDMAKTIEALKKDPNVEYVQPNYKLEVQALPTDPKFSKQWGLLNSAQEVEGYVGRTGVDINAVNAWNITKGATTVVVGVLDTGIDINHNDLKNNIYVNTKEIAGNGKDDDNNGYIDDVKGWDFVNADNTVYDSSTLDLHGTHAAGIIAAGTNTEGISGVAPNVKLLPLKFINGNWGYTCDAIDAIEYAMKMGVKIVNCSFGGTDNNFALKDTMVNSGILFVCAAGNRGADVSISPVYPACFNIPNVLSVASIDSMGVISPYSSYGNKIHVAAPGINILSTTPDNTYDYFSGTSASAPFVTGAAALLKSYAPTLNYDQLAQRIKNNVVSCTNLQGKVTTGGRVDANAVLTNVKPANDTYTGPGNDTGTVPAGQQGGNEDTWYTQDQLSKIKEKMHYGEGGVNPASGNYSFTVTDLSVPAPGFMINISRTYNSRDSKSKPLGQGWTFGFEGMVYGTDVVEVTLPSGSAQRFRLEAGVYKPEDSRSTFTKNADNTYTLTTKDQYKYTFNTDKWLTKMEDRNGNTVNIQVATDGKVQKITDAVGREFSVVYNPNGLIDTITAPEGVTIKYAYDSSNRLITVTDAMGGIMRYAYDNWGYIKEIQDHYQKPVAKITYNHSEGENQHKVSQAIDSLGDTVNYSYDMTNKKTTATDANGRVTTYWFDSAMYTIREQDPEGKSSYTEYFTEGGKNKYGDVKSVTDRNGNKTEYTIDDRGNVTKITNPDLSYKEYAYDDKNNLIKERNETDRYTFYIYDADKKLLLKKAQPINGTDQYTAGSDESKFAITTYQYYSAAEAQTSGSNAKALLKSVTDPEGNTTTYTYDADGNIKGEKNPEGKETINTYNRIGLKTNEKTPKGYNTQYVYDKNGLLEKVVQNGGETTRIEYDKVGRKVQEIASEQYNPTKDDMVNHTYTDNTVGYRYEYYDSGKLKTVTDPEGNPATYTYDVYGNTLTETRANGSILRYEYDVMDRLKKVYFKDTASAAEVVLKEYSYAILYDSKTQETETEYLDEEKTAITVSIYDYAGRLVEKQNPDGTREKTDYNPDGTVKSTVTRDGSISYYKYDGMNRLSGQWTPAEIATGDVLYQYAQLEYDKAGNKTAEKTGKDKVVLYAVPTHFVVKSYTYYKDGNVKTAEDREGRKTEYGYDDDGNLEKEDTYTGSSSKITIEYTYNHLGKPAEKKQQVEEGDIEGYTFGSATDKILLTAYTYDKNGNLKTQTTPDNVTTTYTYDKLNRQTGISQPGVDEAGNAVEITSTSTYNWEGKTLTTTDAKGNTTIYEYSQIGNLVKVKDAKEGVTVYGYDRAGRRITEVSPQNYDPAKSLDQMNRIQYDYDAMDRVIAKKDNYMDPKTEQWMTLYTRTMKYDDMGRVLKELDALGYEAGTGATIEERIDTGYGKRYTYDLAGNLLTMTDPVSEQRGLPYTVKNEYDALGRKISETNANGVITLYTLDDAGNATSVTVKKHSEAAEKQLKGYTYDLAGRLLSETDANGNVVEYGYNALGKQRKVTFSGDATIEAGEVWFQYDEKGNLTYKKDTTGKVEKNTYDNQGRVLTFTREKEDGTETITLSYRYDKNGNKRYETDGNNVTRENVYDELNRLEETKMTVNGILKATAFGYDANGNQTTVTDWKGNTYTNIYDPLNRLIEKKDPYVTVQKLEYTHNSLQNKSYDALGQVTQFHYDRNGRLINTIDPEGHITTQTYDDMGNIQSKSDGRGITTAYGYDEYNRLVSVTNAKGETTNYTYDGNGNMLTQTDAKENTTSFEYNVANKVTRRIDHGGRTGKPGSYTYIHAKTESYTYYPDGSLKTKKDRNGKTTDYIYDIHGRLKSQEIGTEAITYTYDGNGNQLTMTDSTGTTTRTYDEENRVLSKQVPEIGTTTFEYDILEGEGCHAEVATDPKGNVTKKAYDQVGRLVKVEEGTNVTTYTYYDNGSRESVTYPDGAKEVYTYYEDGLTKTLTNTKADGTVIDAYSYTYDAAHNQASKTDKKGVTRYEYDSLNRLYKVTEPDSKTTTYLFDRAGNRVQETVVSSYGSVVTAYTYNEQNRLTGTLTRTGAVTEKVTYDYDNNGNTMVKVKETTKPVAPELTGSFAFNKAGMSTVREVTFMEYNVWNQMVKTIEGDKTILCKYNGEGYRVEKSVNGQATKYLYEADKVVLEVDGQGNQTARNIYGTNLLMRSVGAEKYYFMYNGHGDVTALLDSSGSVVGTYYYDAFGNPVAEGTNENGINNPIRYAGYQWDEETEIYYLNARYYDPKIARFLTEDTYRGQPNDPLSLNLYTYCHNEPMMYTDPSGHFSLPVLIGIGTVIDAVIDIISGGSSGNSGSGSNDDDDRDRGGSGNSNNGSRGNGNNTSKNENGRDNFGLANIVESILKKIERLKEVQVSKNTNKLDGLLLAFGGNGVSDFVGWNISGSGYISYPSYRPPQWADKSEEAIKAVSDFLQKIGNGLSGEGFKTVEELKEAGVGWANWESELKSNIEQKLKNVTTPEQQQAIIQEEIDKIKDKYRTIYNAAAAPWTKPMKNTLAPLYSDEQSPIADAIMAGLNAGAGAGAGDWASTYSLKGAVKTVGRDPMDIIQSIQKAGKGNTGIGSGTYSEAWDAGWSWVGPNAKTIYNKNGELIGLSSENGLRAFRVDYKPKWNQYQANFQQNQRIYNSTKKVDEVMEVSNAHLTIIDK